MKKKILNKKTEINQIVIQKNNNGNVRLHDILPLYEGITLISLVITIILLLILAGVTLNFTIGENGIFKLAEESGKEYIKSENNEIEMLNEIYEKISPITNKPIIIVQNKEEWVGKQGKKVTILQKEGYIIKYTLNGINPDIDNGEEYNGEFIVKDNCTIKAVYIDNSKIIQKVGEIAIEEITKIDKQDPIEFEIKLTENKTSIKIEVVKAKDAQATLTDGESGISEYRYKREGKEWSDWTKDTVYTCSEIYGDLEGVTCTIVAEVRDQAGNVMQVSDLAKTKCLNTAYYTKTQNHPIVTISSKDKYADYTAKKMNAGGSICGITWYWIKSSLPAIAPIIVSNTSSGAKLYANGYREIGRLESSSTAFLYHGERYYFGMSAVLDRNVFSRYYNANFPTLRKLE